MNFCVRNVNISISLHCTKYNFDEISLLTSADFYLFHKLSPIPTLRIGKSRNWKKLREAIYLKEQAIILQAWREYHYPLHVLKPLSHLNGISLVYSRVNGRFTRNIQFWEAIFSLIKLIHNILTHNFTTSSRFHLEKPTKTCAFFYPNVKILLRIFIYPPSLTNGHKKENRKSNLCWISGSPIRLTKNINAKFYRQAHEANHHHSRRNYPPLSTLHRSNEFHQ